LGRANQIHGLSRSVTTLLFNAYFDFFDKSRPFNDFYSFFLLYKIIKNKQKAL